MKMHHDSRQRTISYLLLSQSHLQLRSEVGDASSLEIEVFWLFAVDTDIVVHDNMGEHQFHLLRGKEAAWTGMLTVPERQIGLQSAVSIVSNILCEKWAYLAGRDDPVTLLCGNTSLLLLTSTSKAESIVLVCMAIDGLISMLNAKKCQ